MLLRAVLFCITFITFLSGRAQISSYHQAFQFNTYGDYKYPIPYRIAGKWGYCNKQLIVIIPCKYDSVGFFSDNNVVEAVVRLNNKYGLIDASGHQIAACKYDSVGSFNYHSEAIVVLNHRYGLIDASGNEIIPCKYDWVCPFDWSNRAIIMLHGKYGYANKQGRVVIRVKYTRVESFNETFAGCAKVQIGPESFVIDTNGHIVKNPVKVWIQNCVSRSSYCYSTSPLKQVVDGKIFTVAGKYGFYFNKNPHSPFKDFQEKNDTVIQPLYDNLIIDDSVLTVPMWAFAEIEKQWGLISLADGKILVPLQYDSIYFDSYLIVKKQGKIGIINPETRNTILPIEYDSIIVGKFDGFSVIEKNSLCGLIDFDGTLVLPPKYGRDFSLVEGVGLVKVTLPNGTYGYVDVKDKGVEFFDK